MLGFLVKIICLVVLAILIRGTLPRYRIDQLISLNWKFWIFLCVAFFLELVCLTYLFLL